MKTRVKILSILLHYANRTSFDKRIIKFYHIKNMLLNKYGKFEKYDLQFIEGKKCYSCDGTGIYHNWYTGMKEGCYNCYSGWYKKPFWSLLEVIKFGDYYFHQPKEKLFEKPKTLEVNIEGYIQHKEPHYGFLAVLLLLFIYDKKSMKLYYKMYLSNGWRTQWWKPYNMILNIIHLIKKRHRAIPIVNFTSKIKRILNIKKPKIYYSQFLDDNLPF